MNRVQARAERLRGYFINDSSNVLFVGWQDGNMLVMFGGRSVYLYKGVSRQRAVACALAPSVGSYINRRIRGRFEAVKVL